MFGKKEEAEPVITPKAVLYEFHYTIGFRGAQPAGFYNKGFQTIADADVIRVQYVELLKRAMTEKTVEVFANNIAVRGEDITWFVVNNAREMDDEN